MARVKGFNPPDNEYNYTDADGVIHYQGEFIRSIFGDGSISPGDLETDIVGQSRRGERPVQQGAGSSSQKNYREAFKNCTLLWNTLQEVCPVPCPDPPPTSKKSVWDAKLEFGVTCSYLDLFLKCCIKWALGHGGAMPDGDCFPCVPTEACDGVSITYETDQMGVGDKQTLGVDGAALGFGYKWEIVSGPGTLATDDSAAKELAALIDVGETEIEKINITEAWIEANKSATTSPVINPISEVEHDAYSLVIDGMTFYFDGVYTSVIAAVMAYAYDGKISPTLKNYLYAIQIVNEDQPREPNAVASYTDEFMTVWGDREIDAGTIAHEAGHGLAQAIWGGFSPGMESDYRAAIDSGEPPVSEYGATSPFEDFTTAIYLYTEDPEELLAIAPLRYAAIVDLLSGNIFYGYPVIYFAPSSVDDVCVPEFVSINLMSGANICDNLQITIGPGVNDMSWDYDLSAETIAPSGSVSIFVKDGAGPFNWEVSGAGFSLGAAQTASKSNTLISGAGACGSASILVTDVCEKSCTGYVRCTSGGWSGLIDGCVLAIPAQILTVSGAGIGKYVAMSSVQGKYTQYHTIGNCKYYSSPPVGCDSCNNDICLTGWSCFVIWGSGWFNCDSFSCGNIDNPCVFNCLRSFNIRYKEWVC